MEMSRRVVVALVIREKNASNVDAIQSVHERLKRKMLYRAGLDEPARDSGP